MRIQHNIAAMNAYRNYNINTSAVSKNLEKLSSGYKINRAGDDAAGLAISEKMRAQITGLDAASKNVKDGISLVKTAEGAMQEVQDMLNRMVNLATQSANGTYDNEVDRDNLQKEVDQLRSEINRIADSANFNGIKLLDGSLEGDTTSYEVKLSGQSDLSILTTAGPAASGVGTVTIVHKDATEGNESTSFSVSLDGASFTKVGATAATITMTIGGTTITASGIKSDLSDTELAEAFAKAIQGTGGSGQLTITTAGGTGVKYDVAVDGDKLVFTMAPDSAAAITDNADFTGNFAVGQITSDTNGNMGSSTINNQTQDIKEGSLASGTILANTVTEGITFDSDWFTDGKAIKVGDETYVFALTKETAKAQYGAGYKVVDVTDLVDPATKKLYANEVTWSNALTRLTEVASDNEMFTVGLEIDENAGDMQLSFQEKSTYRGDADLTTRDNIQKQIQFIEKVTVKENTIKGKGAALTLQIGDTSDSFNQLKVSIGDIHTDALDISKISIATQTGAQAAVDTIKNAINTVSSIRGTLGATQNRLEHTQNNLSVMKENIQDAESTIRDTDVAEEMMAYTKNNILVQSAQAMLAQANQIPQGVLQLLG